MGQAGGMQSLHGSRNLYANLEIAPPIAALTLIQILLLVRPGGEPLPLLVLALDIEETVVVLGAELEEEMAGVSGGA